MKNAHNGRAPRDLRVNVGFTLTKCRKCEGNVQIINRMDDGSCIIDIQCPICGTKSYIDSRETKPEVHIFGMHLKFTKSDARLAGRDEFPGFE